MSEVIDGEVISESAAEVAPAPAAPVSPYRRRTFAERTSSGLVDSTQGRQKVDKKNLIGVPHIITGWVMREGASDVGYASVEAITENDIDIIYNDSGMGVREQLANYLVDKGMISVPGPKAPWQDWTIIDKERIKTHTSKKGNITLVITDVELFVRNGLRVSEYTWHEGKKTGEAETYYLD